MFHDGFLRVFRMVLDLQPAVWRVKIKVKLPLVRLCGRSNVEIVQQDRVFVNDVQDCGFAHDVVCVKNEKIKSLTSNCIQMLLDSLRVTLRKRDLSKLQTTTKIKLHHISFTSVVDFTLDACFLMSKTTFISPCINATIMVLSSQLASNYTRKLKKK